MPESIDHEAEVLAEVADLIAEYPDIPLAELAAGLERRADVYENGDKRALAIAAALRRRASSTTVTTRQSFAGEKAVAEDRGQVSGKR